MEGAPLLLKEDSDLLLKVLRVGLEPAAAPASHTDASDAYVQLAELGAELRSEAAATDPLSRWAELAARRSLFDRALVGRLSCTNAPVFDYLIASFRRCADTKARARALSPEADELFGYVAGLCVSYAAIALLNPSMFPQPAAVEREGVLRILPYLRRDGLDSGLPPTFLSRLVARMQEDDGLEEFGLPLFQALAASLKPKSILEGFEADYRALHALVREKPLGALLARDATFVPPVRTGHALETSSVLGPFLGLSCFPSDRRVPEACFPSFSAPDVEGGTSSLRLSLQVVHMALKSIATELLKNAEAKEHFFRLVAAACSLNMQRAQQYFPHAETQRLVYALEPNREEAPQLPVSTSSDGFMINLGAALLQLCEPFTAPGSPHAAKIDSTYLLSTHRLNLDKETRLCATADDVMYWLDPRNPDLRRRYLDRLAAEAVEPDPEGTPPLEVSASFGTVTEYFFLTMRVLHVGLLSSFTLYHQLAQQHHRWRTELELREAELTRMRGLGGAIPVAASALLETMEAETTTLRKSNDTMKRFLLCYAAQLTDPKLLSLAIRYYRLVARWLVASVDPPSTGLPLPAKVPRLFSSLPESCMDDVAQFLKHLTNFAPHVLEDLAVEEMHDFVTMMVTFLGSPKYVKNPYLRATFTKLLRYLVPRSESNEALASHGSERLAAVFHTHRLAQAHLAPALMQFFVDIEFTGSHTGAYDKYEYRHEMCQILEYLWTLPEYRQAMIGFTRETPKFVRFVNMLINDSIFSMDEALTKLATIRTVQAELADQATWAAQPRNVAHQRMQQHTQDENTARYFMQFTSEVLHMMEYLTAEEDVARVFMLPELVGRVASMLNYFLAQLVGPKCSNLKVKEPEKYHFHPKKLLLNIATIITHFAPFDAFGQAVVRDERSYNPNNMGKAVRVLASGLPPIMGQKGLLALEAFRSKCIDLKAAEQEEEENLGEIPDDFLDPITMEIMVDPVRLPSGTVIDRPTICRHLLSDETDPFTRQRLTVEMLVPDEDMKKRIEEFRLSRKRAAAGCTAPSAMEIG